MPLTNQTREAAIGAAISQALLLSDQLQELEFQHPALKGLPGDPIGSAVSELAVMRDALRKVRADG